MIDRIFFKVFLIQKPYFFLSHFHLSRFFMEFYPVVSCESCQKITLSLFCTQTANCLARVTAVLAFSL